MVLSEAGIGLASGAVFGAVSLVVGHPLDTIKTKMQAPSLGKGNINMHNSSAVRVAVDTVRREGVVGLYRGCVPPLLGSSLLRSVQFGTYEAVYAALSGVGRKNLEKTTKRAPGEKVDLRVDWRIAVAGGSAGVARALLECPLEVAKIQRQVRRFPVVLYLGFLVNVSLSLLCFSPLRSKYFLPDLRSFFFFAPHDLLFSF
jgi:solute carrier family 25 (mitochondrial carnitine/acylcarnitine transporter), member 20/29